MFKGSDGLSVRKSVLLEQDGENRLRQIKKNENKADAFPAESLEREREKETLGHPLSVKEMLRKRICVSRFFQRMKWRKVKGHSRLSLS